MLLVSLILAGLAAIYANRWMAGQLASADRNAELSLVAAATVEIPFGTKLDATHVKMIELPPASVPEGSFTDASKPLGLIAIQTIYKGEVLIAGRVVETLGGSALSAVVSPGIRAITVRVDEVIGVAGFVLPGNRVDIIASQSGQSGGDETRTLIENLKVLAIGQTSSPDKETPVVVRAVTLEVTPRQAEDIVRATQAGRLQLVLRNPLEDVPQGPADPLAETESPLEDPVVPVNPPPASAATGSMEARVVTVEVMRRTNAQCAIFGTNSMGDIVSEEVIADRCRPTSQP
jgi:pilus assembly protein CpaB